MEEQIILIDGKDREIGTGGKMAVHQEGLLHRAFSVVIFNSKGEILLQQRAKNKYHCAGLWTNTCCSHPRPGETILAAAKRRLFEEMGIVGELKEVFSFHYQTSFPDGLTENEYDHVLIGKYDGLPIPDPKEVGGWKWTERKSLISDIEKHPEVYTYWFKYMIEKLPKTFPGYIKRVK